MDKKFWNKKTRSLQPYIPGEQPKGGFIKLNTNENPYPPSPSVRKVLDELKISELLKYPDPGSRELRKSIAAYFKMDKDQVFVGNGSDEVLAFAFRAFFDADTPVAFPDITYSFYPVYASSLDIPVETIKLREDFSFDIKSFAASKSGCVIANPNAPTGMALSLKDLDEIISAQKDRLVIVDEAYVDFGAKSCAGLVEKYDNLLVIQTLSKSRSLAGIRLGFALGNPSLIRALEAVRDTVNSYTTDTLAQKIAGAAMEDAAYFEDTRNKIIDSRRRFAQGLDKLGFKTLPSETNFVFTSHPGIFAGDLYRELRKKNILVRYFDLERIDNYIRITIGKDGEMDEVLRAMEEILKTGPGGDKNA